MGNSKMHKAERVAVRVDAWAAISEALQLAKVFACGGARSTHTRAREVFRADYMVSHPLYCGELTGKWGFRQWADMPGLYDCRYVHRLSAEKARGRACEAAWRLEDRRRYGPRVA